jgi:DNA-binding transcriptional MerR regulator
MTKRLWMKIGEAAQQIGATPKELRYWESVIPELRPRRSQGNLRYYHIDELPRLQKVHEWIAEGLTVADCRQLFTTGQLARPLGLGLDEEVEPIFNPGNPPPPKKRKPTRHANPDLKPVVKALKTLLKRLSEPPFIHSEP